uniref:Uncharacterized protein n=1 Tax=Cairina moschata TaxID=8855 RepID=A0A8C3B6V2_CAIMO
MKIIYVVFAVFLMALMATPGKVARFGWVWLTIFWEGDQLLNHTGLDLDIHHLRGSSCELSPITVTGDK